MNKLYIIKDKTEKNFYKPFVSIHKSKDMVEKKVNQLKNTLSKATQELVSYDEISVMDFDPNKTQVFVVFDKTDRKAPMSMHFNFVNAEKHVSALKKGIPNHAHKLIVTQVHRVE